MVHRCDVAMYEECVETEAARAGEGAVARVLPARRCVREVGAPIGTDEGVDRR